MRYEMQKKGRTLKLEGAGNMLKFPLQFEQRLQATTRQLKEAECVGWGRSGQQRVTICGPGGVPVRRINIQRGYVLDKELVVNARAANWVVHRSWRVKRSFSSGRCKFWLNKQLKVSARDLSPPGLLVVPVSYTATPDLETNDRILSPASIEEKERFLKALVAGAPLMVSNDTNTTLTSNVDDEEDEGRADSNPREEGHGETNKVSRGKQKWPLDMQNFSISPEMQRKKMDWTSNSDDLRGLEEKILLLESVDVDTTKVLALYPAIVNISVEKLKSVIGYLESCGLRRRDLGRILSMTPQILGLSVECHLRHAVRFLLREVGLPKNDFRKVINRCPRLLVASVDSQMRPTKHFLEGLGFNRMASLVSNNATLLTFGIQSKLLPKLEFLQTLGMSRDEAVTLVVRFPAIFNYGVEQNLQPKYDYLINVMGRNVDHLKAFPQYFGYSLDHRIRPRHEFLRQRNMQASLPMILKLSDDEFYRRFKGARVRDAGGERKLAAVIGSAVDQVGEERKLAAVIGSQVDEAVEERKLAVIGSQLDEVWEKPKLAPVNESEAANRRRIPVDIGL